MGEGTKQPPVAQETLDKLPDEEDVSGDEEDLPPLRMHATRVPQRLSSGGPLPPEKHQRRRSGSCKEPRSRSRSPSVKNSDFDTGSSISSLQDLEDWDPDILLDKAGFEELDPVQTQANVKDLQSSMSSLKVVNERLCNDDLEDVHAFSDVNVNKKPSHSRDNSIATGEAILETLDEEEDENGYENNNDNDKRPEVILENMENLDLDDREEDGGSQDPGSNSVPTSWEEW